MFTLLYTSSDDDDDEFHATESSEYDDDDDDNVISDNADEIERLDWAAAVGLVGGLGADEEWDFPDPNFF